MASGQCAQKARKLPFVRRKGDSPAADDYFGGVND
jgi:hypothetical protein